MTELEPNQNRDKRMSAVKDYYRLNELERNFNITEEDVLYLAENSKINLLLFCKEESFIVGAHDRNEDYTFSAFGLVKYRGLISIPKAAQIELLDKGKVSIQETRILQRENITSWCNDYPYKTAIPNHLIARWTATQQDKISATSLPARFSPSESEHLLRSLFSDFKKFTKSIPDNPNTSTKEMENLVNTSPEYHFNWRSVTFSKDDIRITTSAIEQAQELLGKKDATPNNKQRTKLLHELIDRALADNLNAKARSVWAAIKEDTDLDMPIYDTESIIEEIGKDTIYWRDLRGAEQSMTWRTFENYISNKRKEIKNHNS